MDSVKSFEVKNAEQVLEKEATPLTRQDVDNSPFVVIGNDENGWVGTMGKYRLTEEFETLDECKEDLKEITWNRIVQVLVLINQINEIKDEQ